MRYDRDLAMQICRNLGIKWNPNASEVTLCGKPLPEDFSVKALFEGAYDQVARSSAVIPFEYAEQDELSEKLNCSYEYHFSEMVSVAA